MYLSLSLPGRVVSHSRLALPPLIVSWLNILQSKKTLWCKLGGVLIIILDMIVFLRHVPCNTNMEKRFHSNSLMVYIVFNRAHLVLADFLLRYNEFLRRWQRVVKS